MVDGKGHSIIQDCLQICSSTVDSLIGPALVVIAGVGH